MQKEILIYGEIVLQSNPAMTLPIKWNNESGELWLFTHHDNWELIDEQINHEADVIPAISQFIHSKPDVFPEEYTFLKL